MEAHYPWTHTGEVAIYSHVLLAYVVGLGVSPTFGGDSLQVSHQCETFWRLLYGPNNGIHTRCVNPHHLRAETKEVNLGLHKHCSQLAWRPGHTWGCACGAYPPCLNFTGEAYIKQVHALSALFTEIHQLAATIPTELEFVTYYNCRRSRSGTDVGEIRHARRLTGVEPVMLGHFGLASSPSRIASSSPPTRQPATGVVLACTEDLEDFSDPEMDDVDN
jgi:hypothetical protein